MTKSEKRELNFRNAMTKDLYLFFEQGIITHHTFQVAVSSLAYIITRPK